jgi:putative N-acetylmannosamine-6-phosphate epimerase
LTNPLFDRFAGGLIVSVQALPGEPMHGAEHIVAMARAAQQGGASALRLNGPDDIRAVKRRVPLPIIGLFKQGQSGVYITPSVEAARQVVMAGADIVAIDATHRMRPDGLTFAEQIAKLKDSVAGVLVMADVATVEEGVAAAAAGADLVGTTLAGYTDDAPATPGPDFALLQGLLQRVRVPVILEGRVWTPEEAAHGLAMGAWAVVVGSAITRPQLITERFVNGMKAAQQPQG